ncbi:hypothetical protein BDZ45DRAFT_750574 [Acephala macrosclerotiorum]|nr:hypothetical protein BDZ45DRAFT_750574 [Acephala macrosclerotiorum]
MIPIMCLSSILTFLSFPLLTQQLQDEELSAASQVGIEEVSAFLAKMHSGILQGREEELGWGQRRSLVATGGQYPLPNDKQEQERLYLQHKGIQIAFRGNLRPAPLGDNPQNVLDVGTGTGIWAINFANEHHSARVLGTYLNSMHPASISTNCRFQVADAEEEWNPPNRFDLNHGRSLMPCFKGPRVILRHAFKALKLAVISECRIDSSLSSLPETLL